MYYNKKVISSEVADKLKVQSEIDSISDQVSNHWNLYSNYFRQSESRLTQSLNKVIDEFIEDWNVTNIHWPFEVMNIENGIEISGHKCFNEEFQFTFGNSEHYCDIIFRFSDLSYESGKNAFEDLDFELMRIEVSLTGLYPGMSFDAMMRLIKTNDFIEHIKNNFDSFRGALTEEFLRMKQKCDVYAEEVRVMLDRHMECIETLLNFERAEKMKEFILACNELVIYETPRWIRISHKNSVIAKSIKIERVHQNYRYVDVKIEEMVLGASETTVFRFKSYQKVLINTLFGFNLSQEENLNLLANVI